MTHTRSIFGQRPGLDNATLTTERIHHSSSFRLLITGHFKKGLVLACQGSLDRSDRVVVQRVRNWRRDTCNIHPELSTFDILKYKDEAIRYLRACRWRICVFSAPGSYYHCTVFAFGSWFFAVSSHVAAEVFRAFGTDRVEPNDAIWAEESVTPVPRQDRVVEERAIAPILEAMSVGQEGRNTEPRTLS